MLPFAHMIINGISIIYFCGKSLGNLEAKEKAID